MQNLTIIVYLLLIVISSPAIAYVGPGLGAGVFGVIIGIVLSIFVALFAIFWYPIKRLLGLGKKKSNKTSDSESKDSN